MIESARTQWSGEEHIQFFSRTVLLAQYSIRGLERTSIPSRLETARVAVTGNQLLLRTPNGQHMALMAVNQLCRFCSHLDIVMPRDIDTVIDSPAACKTKLLDNLLELPVNVYPAIEVRAPTRLTAPYDVVLSIGSASVGSGSTVIINSDGWMAYLSTEGNQLSWTSELQNPIGAHAAASLGVAEVFKTVFRKVSGCNQLDVRPSGSLIFSAFDYGFAGSANANPPLPKSIPLGTVHLISAGAINSSLAYSLRAVPGVTGKLVVIEPQEVEISNLNRYLLTTANDAIRRRAKVDVLRTFVEDVFEVETFQMEFQRYRDHLKKGSLDLAIVGVDRDESRWEVQNEFPRVILSGGTEASVIQISRHDDFSRAACLGCLYPRRSCAERTGTIETEPSPSISFVSGLTGTLLSAEIIKERDRAFRANRLQTVLYMDALKVSLFRIRQPTKSVLCGCRCQDPAVLRAYSSIRTSRAAKATATQ